jgi:prepilin-type N-terminal cleavage/methylation domain-containing protein
MAHWRVQRFKGQQGYTFNELLVAMAIGVIALLAYTLNSASVFRHQTSNGNATIALNLAQDKLEELQARRNLANENRCPNGGDLGINARGDAGGVFDRCWKVMPSGVAAGLKQIDVTVSWRDFEARELTLSTLIYAGS